MSDYASELQAVLKARKLTAKWVATTLNVSEGHISHVLNGKRELSDEHKAILEKYLGPINYVTRSQEIAKVTKGIPTSEDLTIPLHWQSAPAGDLNPIVTESYDEFNITKRYAGTFAVYIRGESMIGAGIEDGDIAVFREDGKPRDGQVVYACVNNMCTVKVYKEDEKGRVKLIPANKKYKEIPVNENDTLTIRGVLINVVRESKLYKEG